MKLLIFLFIIGVTAYCSQVEEDPVVVPKTTIEVEADESQKKTIGRTLVWDKKARKYLRKEKKEDVE
jgi:hypothetical protein